MTHIALYGVGLMVARANNDTWDSGAVYFKDESFALPIGLLPYPLHRVHVQYSSDVHLRLLFPHRYEITSLISCCLNIDIICNQKQEKISHLSARTSRFFL